MIEDLDLKKIEDVFSWNLKRLRGDTSSSHDSDNCFTRIDYNKKYVKIR